MLIQLDKKIMKFLAISQLVHPLGKVRLDIGPERLDGKRKE